MNKLKRKIFTCLLMIPCHFWASSLRIYEVRPGETLSTIAQENFEGPVYGKNESLSRIISLNPHVTNPNLIYPGQKIYLDTPASSQVSPASETTAPPTPKQIIPEKPSSAAERSIRPDPSLTDPYSSFHLSPVFGFSKLDSDQNGTSKSGATSDLGFGFQGDWQQHWTSTFKTKLWFSYQKYSFSVSNNRTLVEDESSLTQFGLGISQEIFNRLNLALDFGYRSSPYLRARSTTQLELEDVQAAFATTTAQIHVFKLNHLGAHFNLHLGHELGGDGANISTDGGINYGLGVNLYHQLDWGEITGGLDYNNQMNSFNNVETQAQEIKFSLGVRFYLGK